MWVMTTAAVVVVLLALQVLFIRGLIPPLVLFIILFSVVAGLAFFRPRPWVFAVGVVVNLAFLATAAPFILDTVAKPTSTDHQWSGMLLTAAGIGGLVSGVAGFRELRRGAGITRAFRAPLGDALAMLMIGVLVGAVYVSVRGYSALKETSGLGFENGVTAAPTQPSLQLTAQNTAYVQTALQAHTGSGAIYVTNQDSSEHTFDITVGGKHFSYPLPAKSTTGVVLNLSSAGRYTYYCAIPGHRPAMEGTLTVQ
jgi:plastocyanin